MPPPRIFCHYNRTESRLASRAVDPGQKKAADMASMSAERKITGESAQARACFCSIRQYTSVITVASKKATKPKMNGNLALTS